jgi:hypothetical protein
MALSIIKAPPADRYARGFSVEALTSFHISYVGEIEFGHFFSPREGIWRWVVEFPLWSDTTGLCDTADDARGMLLGAYNELLTRAHLVEAHPFDEAA